MFKLLTSVQYSRSAWFLDDRTSILVYVYIATYVFKISIIAVTHHLVWYAHLIFTVYIYVHS